MSNTLTWKRYKYGISSKNILPGINVSVYMSKMGIITVAAIDTSMSKDRFLRPEIKVPISDLGNGTDLERRRIRHKAIELGKNLAIDLAKLLEKLRELRN
jgi:hypothetical protein